MTLKVPSNPPVLRLAMAVSSATARPLLPTARLGGEEPGWGGPGVTVGVWEGGVPHPELLARTLLLHVGIYFRS